MIQITISKSAQHQLTKIPVMIRKKLAFWIKTLRIIGYNETMKIKGFYDEPLKGTRRGQRSIRLSKAYRAIYITKKTGKLRLVEMREVNKHDY